MDTFQPSHHSQLEDQNGKLDSFPPLDHGSVMLGDFQDYKESQAISEDFPTTALAVDASDTTEDEYNNSVQVAQYEDTTKLYEIINHYTDDEILTIEISHDIDEQIATISNGEKDLSCCNSIDTQSVAPSENGEIINANKSGNCCVNMKDESIEDMQRIFLTGHPGDILGQIFDDQLGILYNIYR